MIERAGYPTFRQYPATGPQVSPIRPIDAITRNVLVTLAGPDFVAEVQVSNAQTTGPQPHLFSPPDESFDTFATVRPIDPPLLIPSPIRWVRVVLTSGTLTGGNIEEGSRDDTASLLPTVRAKIEEVDSTIAGAQATVAGLVADTEQYSANAAALFGATPVPNQAAIPAAPGLYFPQDAASEGLIYERPVGGGTPVPRPDLQAASAKSVAPAIRATRTTVTPEDFDAPGGFDPAYARTLYGTPAWAEYLNTKNASPAFQRAFSYAAAHPGTTLRIPADGYYLGSLTFAQQRALGRTIYGPPANLTDVGTVYSRDVYAQMPVMAEGVTDLIIEGAGCRLYQGEGASTSLAFAQSSGVHFTGRGSMYGFTPPNGPQVNTENNALIRVIIGTRDWSVGDGWSLGAFLGDGVLAGGLATDGGGTDPAFAAYDGRVDATIRERWGDGTRPWFKAGTLEYGVSGDAYGSRSRLAVAVIHGARITVSSKALYGGVDFEANLDGQLMVDLSFRAAHFPELRVLPLSAGAHPWQEEKLVSAGTAGAVRVESSAMYTSPAENPTVSGGGVFATHMEYGYFYMHGSKIADIDGLTFTEGALIFGNQGVDIGKTTSGGSVRNVSAKKVLRKELYGAQYENNPYPLSNALIVLSGNVRDTLFENVTVDDAAASAIALSHVPNHTGGNSEAGNTYIRISNTGAGTGEGKTLAFTPDATSKTQYLVTVKGVDSDPGRIHATLQYSRANLITGNTSPLTNAVRIWDEYGSLMVRAAKDGEVPDLGLTFPLTFGRVAERENVERRNVLMFGNAQFLRAAMISATDAINKAIASLPAEGGRIYFPNGLYLIDGAGINFGGRLGVLFEGESRYGTQLINAVVDNHMISGQDCQMIGFENMEMIQQGQKAFGAYIDVKNAALLHATRLRLQSPYRGLQFDGVGGMHLTDVKFVPQDVNWAWNAAIHVQRSAGLFGNGVDVNFGLCPIQNAALVLDGGCDTIYFNNSGFNQIGGSPGGVKGAVALRLQNTNSSFDPRWVRFSNTAFESAGAPAIIVEAGNDVQFIGAYAVNARNCLTITGGSNIKWLGGVLAAAGEHVVEISGGQDVVIDNATIASGGWLTDNTYSGVAIGPAARRVRVSDCNIGDNTTIPEHTGTMALGVAIDNTTADTGHVVRGNSYGPQCTNRVYNGSPAASVQTRRETEGVESPTAGLWRPGDYCRNVAPTILGAAASQYVIAGWRCVTTGTPGTWVEDHSFTGS